ncbi:uncharacterized protein ATC70_007520 [Mucor velutinosus]|uniref:Uncharacterized protein n=1 Tax=Mucor velutinosus TaxID=708070 RepID=A0AAN7D5P3_9FUNG|nr:hypothetical protein ATC70_007520 [Mucor velutinosus]
MSASEGDNSYMAMLNNPAINPGPPKETAPTKKAATGPKPSVFSAVEKAKDLLTTASGDVYLTSESDEPFEWINADIKKAQLPITAEELHQLKLIPKELVGEELKIKSIDEFLKEDDYKNIVAAFKEIQKESSDESKVYLLGDVSITVLILCIVQDKQSSKKAIVGLKSLLVQS